MNLPPVIELQQVAESAALKAGEKTLQLQKESLNITQKGFRDFVTEADLASQRLILEHIEERFPDHEYLTEEADNSAAYSSSVVWIIDPIDGTTNYIRGQPLYTISVAAAIAGAVAPAAGAIERIDTGASARTDANKKQQPGNEVGNGVVEISDYEIAAGVVYDPHRRELFSANSESQSTLNQAPIRVSEVKKLDKTVIGFDWSRDFEQREKMMRIIGRIAHKVHTLRAIGSAAQALAWVACGRLDLYINLGVGPWDVAASKILIENAGGRVTNLVGESWNLSHGGCLASNTAVHDQALELIGQ